jgi:subtilase family serine protease
VILEPDGGPVRRRLRALVLLAVVALAGALFVSCEPSGPEADLTLGTLSASRSSSGQLTLKVFAQNIGSRSVSGVRVRFSEGSRIIGTSGAVSLPGHDARLVSVSGSTISAGSHTFTAVIDPTNAIAESNEANNRSSRTFAL